MLMDLRGLFGALAALTFGLGIASAAQADTLIAGAYPANPPRENKTESGDFEGFEVDLVKEIGKRIGADIEFQGLGLQALFAATSSGRIDLAISSISITNDPLRNQSFTQGYYDSDIALIANSETNMKALDDRKEKVIGAISASVGEAWIKANTDKYGIKEYRGYNTQQDLLLDVQSGRLEGAVGDIAGFQFAFMMKKGPPWKR